MFKPDQIEELCAPLDRANVKERSQAGRSLSYIEGWHVIAEANRIFGFDGWDRNVLEYKCVSERPRPIGREKRDGWSVSYVVHSRVRVGDVIRDGMGAGHGIDADLGMAHESAIKEAETDAMKRALMTFGNQFGLALYDKEQKQVVDVVHEEEKSYTDEKINIKITETLHPVDRCLDYINNAISSTQLKSWWHDTATWRANKGITPSSLEYQEVYEAFVRMGKQLVEKENAND